MEQNHHRGIIIIAAHNWRLTYGGQFPIRPVSPCDYQQSSQVDAQVVAGRLLKTLSIAFNGFVEGLLVGIIRFHETVLEYASLKAVEVGERFYASGYHLVGRKLSSLIRG